MRARIAPIDQHAPMPCAAMEMWHQSIDRPEQTLICRCLTSLRPARTRLPRYQAIYRARRVVRCFGIAVAHMLEAHDRRVSWLVMLQSTYMRPRPCSTIVAGIVKSRTSTILHSSKGGRVARGNGEYRMRLRNEARTSMTVKHKRDTSAAAAQSRPTPAVTQVATAHVRHVQPSVPPNRP